MQLNMFSCLLKIASVSKGRHKTDLTFVGIPLPVVIVWAFVKANWFTYSSNEGNVSIVITNQYLLLTYNIMSRSWDFFEICEGVLNQ